MTNATVNKCYAKTRNNEENNLWLNSLSVLTVLIPTSRIIYVFVLKAGMDIGFQNELVSCRTVGKTLKYDDSIARTNNREYNKIDMNVLHTWVLMRSGHIDSEIQIFCCHCTVWVILNGIMALLCHKLGVFC